MSEGKSVRSVSIMRVRTPSVVHCVTEQCEHEVVASKVYAITFTDGSPPALFVLCPIHDELIKVKEKKKT